MAEPDDEPDLPDEPPAERKGLMRGRFVVGGIAASGAGLGTLAVIMGAAAGLGHRFEWWPLLIAFMLLRFTVFAGLGAVIVSLFGAILNMTGRHWRMFYVAISGIVLGVIVIAIPLSQLPSARGAPPIHDITTDTENPPKFIAAAKLRKETDNPTAYGGPEIARQQRESYSGIMPLKLRSTPRRTFDRALEIARDMGWEITAESRRQGWIEATDTTFWFGFKDDIVIRITGERSGITRIDLRSASRLGDSDLGINAKRVQTFLERLAAKAR